MRKIKGRVLGAVRAIGLMSGTSLDGVDVALIETDGERVARFARRFCRTGAGRSVFRLSLPEIAGPQCVCFR